MPVDLNLPVYTQWPKVPAGLATKTQLAKERLVLPENAQPVAYKKSTLPTRYYPLYRREDTVAMPPKREVKPRDYVSIFVKRYTTQRQAYVEACTALFELNRYAKHDSCTQAHREAIYGLKSAWIQRLYEEGFCTEAIPITTPEKALECRRCGGSGIDEWDLFCTCCDGTGIYCLIESRAYWAFHFQVDGHGFAWHQPAPLSFAVEAMGTQEAHAVVAEVKPVSLPPHKFAEVKALLAWCLENTETDISEIQIVRKSHG
jgi:hypothetical protein